jgi:dTDP-4-dehydrorhamnose reductase
MNIALFGSNGRLGIELLAVLTSAGHTIQEFNRKNFNLNAFIINNKIDLKKVDLVINAIAMTNVDLCESNSSSAIKINVDFPQRLAEHCHSKKIGMIHFSTDYVFNGESNGYYDESSITDPICNYGKSKLKGEEQVLQQGDGKNIIIRTAWLYDRKSKNFLTWFLNEIHTGRTTIRVVCDQFGSPTSTTYLANCVRDIIGVNPNEVLHLTNHGKASWYEFALEIARINKIKGLFIQPISGSELSRIAKRPKNTALRSIWYHDPIAPSLVSWESELKNVLL